MSCEGIIISVRQFVNGIWLSLGVSFNSFETGSTCCSSDFGSAMSSPGKMLQLHSVYTSPTKFHVTGVIASPPKKRKTSERKPEASGLSSLPGKHSSLSPKLWKQWMDEAQELNVSSSVFLATTSSECLAQVANMGMQLILNPVVARTDEKFASSMDERVNELTDSKVSVFSAKFSPTTVKNQQRRSHIIKPRKRKKNLRIEPLLSEEMRTKLQVHLEEKIKGNIWENEIRSRLARPLSASTFCSRSEQLRHPLTTAQFVSLATENTVHEVANTSEVSGMLGPPEPSVAPRFPYSMEAHASANCIRRCRLKAWFRAALKSRARVLAIAIRVLRRRGVPLLVRGFRRRRRAAIRIQRYYRCFLSWRTEILRPFVCNNVAFWVRQALKVAAARVLIARTVTALVLARKVRHLTALQRAGHLRRWAAKTWVCLFVHQIWTVCWFRTKRSNNVAGMKQELALLEVSDHNIHLEYVAIFATPLGKDMLKKELALWRVGARTRALQEKISSVGPSEAQMDPAIMRLRQCFQIFDLDGSGTLNLDEFQLMLSYLRGKKPKQLNRGSISGKRPAQQPPKLTTAQVRNLFTELDRDGNGGITCGEFESWWAEEHERSTLSTSASTNFLSRGLDGLLLQSHGLLFWLLGCKQQLERKFVKKLTMRRTMEKAKREILHEAIDCERVAGRISGVFRCGCCGRRFGLRRDLTDHVAHECSSTELVVDTFTLKRWVHEEEFRLLEEVKE